MNFSFLRKSASKKFFHEGVTPTPADLMRAKESIAFPFTYENFLEKCL